MGSCLIIYTLYLGMRIKMQQIEPDDVTVSRVILPLMSHDSVTPPTPGHTCGVGVLQRRGRGDSGPRSVRCRFYGPLHHTDHGCSGRCREICSNFEQSHHTHTIFFVHSFFDRLISPSYSLSCHALLYCFTYSHYTHNTLSCSLTFSPPLSPSPSVPLSLLFLLPPPPLPLPLSPLSLQFLLADEDSTLLPVFSIIALDFLICLLTRVVVDETEPEEEDEEEEEEDTGTSSVLPILPSQTSSNKSPSPPPRGVSLKEEVFYSTHGEGLVHVLLKATSKLLVYCRLYAMIGNKDGDSLLGGGLSREALDGIMVLAGRDPLQAKDAKPLFHTHIPDEVRDRIKVWNGVLLIDPAHKEKLCNHDLDSSVGELIVQFLNLHLLTFTGVHSFGHTRCLKSALSSLLSLLSTLFDMAPPETFVAPDGTSLPLPPKGAALLSGLVPLSCDVMTEFSAADMLKLVKICGEKAFSLAVCEHRVREGSRLLQLPKMANCQLLGPLLADFFVLLGSMLEDTGCRAVLAGLGPDSTDCSKCVCVCV